MWQKLYFKCTVAPAGVESRISAIYELNGELNVLIKQSEGGPTDDAGINVIESQVNTSFAEPVRVNYFVVSRQHTMLRYQYATPRVVKPHEFEPDHTEFTRIYSAAVFHQKMAQGRVVQLEGKPLIDLQTLLTNRPKQLVEIPENLLQNMGIDEGIGTELLRQNPECIRVFAAMVKAGLFTKENPIRNNHMFAKIIVRNDRHGVSNQAQMRQGLIDLYTTLAEGDSSHCMLSRDIHQTIYHDLFNISYMNPECSDLYNEFNEIVRGLMPCSQTIIDRLFSSPDYVLYAYDKFKSTPDRINCLRYLLENVESPSDLHQFYSDFIRRMSKKQISDAARNPNFVPAYIICRVLGLPKVEDGVFINKLLENQALCNAMMVVKSIFDNRNHADLDYREQNELKSQLAGELKTLIKSADLHHKSFKYNLGNMLNSMFGPGTLESCVARLNEKYPLAENRRLFAAGHSGGS